MIGTAMPEDKTKPDYKVITLRMSPAFYERLAAIAEQDRRSLNAEVLVLLEEAFAYRLLVKGNKENPQVR